MQPAAGQMVKSSDCRPGRKAAGGRGDHKAKCPAVAGEEAEMHMSLRLNVIATALSFAFLTAIVLGLI